MTHLAISQKIVLGDRQQPVAVQIDYQDWLKLKQLLNLDRPQRAKEFFAHHAPLESFLAIEPMEYVNNLRQNGRVLMPENL